MQIKDLHINNIRNHSNSFIKLSPCLNIFTGNNGSGKTSILESIVLAAYSKTFLPTSDSELIKSDENIYRVQVNAVNDLNFNYKVEIKYELGKKKIINSSFGENLLPKDIIGEIPFAVLSPDYKSITFGAPQDRRDFVDRLLSQTNKIYLEDSLKLRKCLKQRNAILHSLKLNPRQDRNLLELWTDELANIAVEIFFKRRKFVEKFKSFLIKSYSEISRNIEEIDLIYQPSINFSDKFEKGEMKELFLNETAINREREIARGATLFGPQKDEFLFKINGRNVKETASQGQHKSLLISLKIAEFEFLKDEKVETPIILLDDIFSELDEERARRTLETILKLKAQTFITMVDDAQILSSLNEFSHVSRFELSNGNICLLQ